jgi:hypothetical protein
VRRANSPLGKCFACEFCITPDSYLSEVHDVETQEELMDALISTALKLEILYDIKIDLGVLTRE